MEIPDLFTLLSLSHANREHYCTFHYPTGKLDSTFPICIGSLVHHVHCFLFRSESQALGMRERSSNICVITITRCNCTLLLVSVNKRLR